MSIRILTDPKNQGESLSFNPAAKAVHGHQKHLQGALNVLFTHHSLVFIIFYCPLELLTLVG